MARTQRSLFRVFRVFRVICAVFGLLLLLCSDSPVFAQPPQHAIDRYEPAERGSDWFASDSLDLRGDGRPNFGTTLAYSYRSIVVRDGAGDVVLQPLRNLAIAHVGGSVVVADRIRFGFSLPLQVFADSAGPKSPSIPGPARDQGFGDLRVGTDLRVFGEYRDPITMVVGAQITIPTGQMKQWMSDGPEGWHIRPRVLFAGEVADVFVWAAQLSMAYRQLSQEDLGPFGSDTSMSASVGMRWKRTIVIGPEIYASTLLSTPFAKASTSAEPLLGIHWLNADQFRIGAGIGRGFTPAFGSPALRVLATAEWAPPAGPDADADGILDARDACPKLYGRRRSDPHTNGCPPDRDHDGVYDPEDACINVPGVRSSEPKENGCPPDRDHDGIPDAQDACPDRRGPRSSDPLKNGCPPDRDHDGVPDDVDTCIDVIGIPTNDPLTNGCPPDSDGDGIDDVNDACPNVPGVKTLDWQTNGCPDPDRDKDGILNDDDACPEEPGLPDPSPRRNGCPLAFVVRGGERIDTREPVKFRPGTSELVDANPVLEAVLTVVRDAPNVKAAKIRVEGHSDDRSNGSNGGNATLNKKTSGDRAAAVVKWLIAHGIEASRLSSEGVGADRPTDTNETDVGRTNNRRIEFHILPEK